MSADIVVREIHRRQGATSVTVRNIITSLRLISDVDWKDLFEEVSLVDDALAADGAYKDMDFPTRNLYRTAIEELARGSNAAELDIAQQRRRCGSRRFIMRRPRLRKPMREKADPGYHLIGGGRRGVLKTTIGYHPRARKWRARLHRASGIGFYVSAIAAVALFILAAALFALAAAGAGAAALCVLAALGDHPRRRRGGRTGQSRRRFRLPRQSAAGSGTGQWRSLAFAHACRRSDASDHARRRSKSRSSAWKSIISPVLKATCISPCSPTGWTRQPRKPTATRLCWRSRPKAWRD